MSVSNTTKRVKEIRRKTVASSRQKKRSVSCWKGCATSFKSRTF
jgi:hypothetical protein